MTGEETAKREKDLDSQSGWECLPCTILQVVYSYLSFPERMTASTVCQKWRENLFSPRLWRTIKLRISTREDGKKAYFLQKCVRFAYHLEVHWEALDGKRLNRIRDCDVYVREFMKMFFQAMRECTSLKVLILRLDNVCSYTPDFFEQATCDLERVLHNNCHIEHLSFGCHPFIKPDCLLNALPEGAVSRLKQLHVATSVSYAVQAATFINLQALKPGIIQLAVDMADTVSSMDHLKVLSIDWHMLRAPLIKGLNSRPRGAAELEKLTLFTKHHFCHPNTHPTPGQWAEFASRNPSVKIHCVFVEAFHGVCESMQLIKPGIHMLKVLECGYIEPQDFSNFLSWHKHSIEALVHVAAWESVQLETGPVLWPCISECTNLKFITFIGHFIMSEILTFLTAIFHPQVFVVSKPHILTYAEASNYLVPIQSSKYTKFREEIAMILQKPDWRPIPKVPFRGGYFTEGQDDVLYTTGEIDATGSANTEFT